MVDQPEGGFKTDNVVGSGRREDRAVGLGAPTAAVQRLAATAASAPEHEPQGETLGSIQVASSLLLSLLNHILDLSKVEADKIALDEQVSSLCQSLVELMKTQFGRAQEKGVALIYDSSEEVPDLVIGDLPCLGQVEAHDTATAKRSNSPPLCPNSDHKF